MIFKSNVSMTTVDLTLVPVQSNGLWTLMNAICRPIKTNFTKTCLLLSFSKFPSPSYELLAIKDGQLAHFSQSENFFQTKSCQHNWRKTRISSSNMDAKNKVKTYLYNWTVICVSLLSNSCIFDSLIWFTISLKYKVLPHWAENDVQLRHFPHFLSINSQIESLYL